MRRNKNNQLVDYSNTIKKSNDVSMAKLNQNLSLNQIQLLAYAIYSTQQNGETYFRKHEFMKKFGLRNYKTKEAYVDSDKIFDLRFSTENIENNKFNFKHVFQGIDYDDGVFTFKWTENMLPHILELKENYVLTDLTVTSHFRSGYSWILYEYLKAHYGYWSIHLSKESLMKLFAVENTKSYQRTTSNFKNRVLNIAVDEINKYTELEVWYEQEKIGNKIIGFKISWSIGKRIARATEKQLSLLREINDEANRIALDFFYLENQPDLTLVKERMLEFSKINKAIDENLTSEKAKEFIDDSKRYYKDLVELLENYSYQRDKSVYFDWIREREEE